MSSNRRVLLPITLVVFGFLISFSAISFAQSNDLPKPNLSAKLIDLTVGLDHFEPMNSLPVDPVFRGDYKRFVDIAYSPESKQLRLTPKAVGTATLTIHDDKGRKITEYLLSVKKSSINKIVREITSLLNDIEGIQIRIANNRVLVDGEVFVVKDISRIDSVVSQYGDQASSIVRLSPIAQRKIAELIERDINDPEIHVRAVNGVFILEGVAADEASKVSAELTAKVYVPDIVVNPSKRTKNTNRPVILNRITMRAAPPAEPDKIIQIVVHYVELNKNYNRGFRFQWTPTLKDDSALKFQTGGDTPGGLLSTLTGTISNLLPKLNYAKEHGHARILQSSSIVTENGKPGSITSESAIPFQIIGPQGQPSTTTTNAGISAYITPNLVSQTSDSIKMEIKFKIGSVTGATQAGPIVSTNNVQTTVTVKSGQSAAIGGLVSNQSGTDFNKLPAASGDNPIFSLYASKAFRRNQSQFVVFVTPVIKSSASAGAEQVKKKFRIRD